MQISKCYELPCLDGRKSFYGKAHVIEGCTGGHTLKSYDTLICFLYEENGEVKLEKLSDAHTLTTRRHIRSFFAFLGYAYPGNREWDELETQRIYTLTKEGATA